MKDERNGRAVAYIVGYIVLLVGVYGLLSLSGMSPHRGVSTAEFCDNYNYLSEYYDLDLPYVLTEEDSTVAGDGDRASFCDRGRGGHLDIG